MSTCAILLAAGFSRRLGRAKQTLIYQGETLVGRTARLAAECGLVPVIVVVNREADFCEALEQRGHMIAMNEQAEEGVASSIRRGVTAAMSMGAGGAVILTCDQIGLGCEHLHKLVADPGVTTASSYKGRKGIPAYFPASDFEELLTLRGDVGARYILHFARAIENEALALDIDTEADAAALDGG